MLDRAADWWAGWTHSYSTALGTVAETALALLSVGCLAVLVGIIWGLARAGAFRGGGDDTRGG